MQKLQPSLELDKINFATSIYTFAGLTSGFFTTLIINTLGRKKLNVSVGILFTLGCAMRLVWINWTKGNENEIIGNFNWAIYG